MRKPFHFAGFGGHTALTSKAKKSSTSAEGVAAAGEG